MAVTKKQQLCYMLERTCGPYQTEKLTKDGFHLVFPRAGAKKELKQRLREEAMASCGEALKTMGSQTSVQEMVASLPEKPATPGGSATVRLHGIFSVLSHTKSSTFSDFQGRQLHWAVGKMGYPNTVGTSGTPLPSASQACTPCGAQ